MQVMQHVGPLSCVCRCDEGEGSRDYIKIGKGEIGQDGGREMMKRKQNTKDRCCKRRSEPGLSGTGSKSDRGSGEGDSHSTIVERDRAARQSQKNIEALAGAAARSSRAVERRVLQKEAPKVRAEHLVQCSRMPGKRKVRTKPSKELYSKGSFSENRDDWNKEL